MNIEFNLNFYEHEISLVKNIIEEDLLKLLRDSKYQNFNLEDLSIASKSANLKLSKGN